MQRFCCAASLTGMLLLAGNSGCVRVKSDPVKVEPIHITVDVNLRVQRELSDVFGDIDAQDPTIEKTDE